MDGITYPGINLNDISKKGSRISSVYIKPVMNLSYGDFLQVTRSVSEQVSE